MMRANYIENQKEFWGPEFAKLAGIMYIPQHDEIAAMGCYTMMYFIADNFQGGKFRNEILDMCGVER